MGGRGGQRVGDWGQGARVGMGGVMVEGGGEDGQTDMSKEKLFVCLFSFFLVYLSDRNCINLFFSYCIKIFFSFFYFSF